MELTEKEILLESNGELWVYNFSRLTAQQIFAAQSWFTFYSDLLMTPPPSAKHLKMTGATEYLREAISMLILPAKKDEDGKLIVERFDVETTPERASKFYCEAVGISDKLNELQRDFFLTTKTSSPESILKSRRQTEAGAILLRLLTPPKSEEPQ